MAIKASINVLTGVKDPILQTILRQLMERIARVESEVLDIGTVSTALSDDLDAGSHLLTNLKDPVSNQDATTKKWVLNAIDASMQSFSVAQDGQIAGDAGGTDDGLGATGCSTAGATGHPAGGQPLTATLAGQIVCGTGNEYPALKAACATQAQRDANGLELVRRMIWHLNAYGFTAGRQQNPSGRISEDKVAFVDSTGVTRAYDVLFGADFSVALPTQMLQVFPAKLVPDGGISD